MIVIIDYGLGNVGSILNMLRKIKADAKISSRVEDVMKANKLILPGVGAFDRGIMQLRELNLIEALSQKVCREGTQILGICLGMQLFTRKSEEGCAKGLGFIDAETVKLNSREIPDLKIPHMGWNVLKIKKDSLLYSGLEERSRFYFVHSYAVKCYSAEDILSTTTYGHDFVSSFQSKNIVGVQYHPEKSHKFGLRVLENFAKRKLYA